MSAPPCVQRWRDRRDSYRPGGETIRTLDYEVAPIADDSTPRAFVERHHYSATYPAARRRFGLYRRCELVGVAVFSHPVNDASLAIFPGERLQSLELGRFVLLDDVPGNGETWFLGRAFDLLRREGMVGVLSLSDPARRTRTDGSVVFGGHVGTIYQAHNAVYLGRARADTLRLLPDGRVLNRRARQKIRAREQGWRYAAGRLEAFGAAPLAANDDARAWLKTWEERLTRPLKHPGNFKYAWTLSRRDRRHLPPSLPYPKFDVPGAAR
jgi:hypothetical protein